MQRVLRPCGPTLGKELQSLLKQDNVTRVRGSYVLVDFPAANRSLSRRLGANGVAPGEGFLVKTTLFKLP